MTAINPYGGASFQGWDMWDWAGAGGADSAMPGVITGPDGTLQRPSPEAAPDPAVVITLSPPGTMPDAHVMADSYGRPGIWTGTEHSTTSSTEAWLDGFDLSHPSFWMQFAEVFPRAESSQSGSYPQLWK